MRPTKVTLTLEAATGNSVALPMDRYSPTDSYGLTLRAVVNGGSTGLATVQYTYDDVFDSSVTPIWSSALMPSQFVGTSTSQNGGVAGLGSVSAFRISCTNSTVADQWTLTVMQQSTI